MCTDGIKEVDVATMMSPAGLRAAGLTPQILHFGRSNVKLYQAFTV